MAVVDSASVRVWPDTRMFRAEMEKWTKRRWSTDVDVETDTSEFHRTMQRLEHEKHSVFAKANLDLKEANAKLKAWQAKHNAIDVEVNLANGLAKVEYLKNRMRELKDQKLNIDVELHGLADAERALRASRDAEISNMREQLAAQKKLWDDEINQYKAAQREARVDHDKELVAGFDDILRDLRGKRDAALQSIRDIDAENEQSFKRQVADWKRQASLLHGMISDIGKDEVDVKLNKKKAEEDLRRLTDDKKVQVQAELASAAAHAHLIALARTRVAHIIVRIKSSEFVAEMQKIMAGMAGLSMMENWSRSMSRFLQELPQTALSLAKFTTILGGIGSVAGSALSTLAPIGRSLQAIGPAALFAIPALGGLTATVFTAVMAFRHLSQSTVEGAIHMNDLWQSFKTGLSGVKAKVQEGLFTTDFLDEFRRLSKFALDELGTYMPQLATTLSGVAVHAMDAWRNALNDGQFKRFFDNLNEGFVRAKIGISGFLVGLTNIGTKGSELFPMVGDWITNMGAKFQRWTETADIAGMMHRGAIQAGFLMDALRNLGGVIAGVFHGMDTGKSSGLESFANTLGRVRAIVNSSQFQTAMRTVFTGAADGANALRWALGPIGDSLARLSPLLGDFFRLMGGSAASALTGILHALAQPVAKNGLYDALTGISMLVRNMPWDELGTGLGSIGHLIGNMSTLVGGVVKDVAPLLAKVGDAAAKLVPPMSAIISTILPPLVAGTGVLLSVVGPLAPLIVAVGAAFLTWKAVNAIPSLIEDIAMGLMVFGNGKVATITGIGKAFDSLGGSVAGVAGHIRGFLATGLGVGVFAGAVAAIGLIVAAWSTYSSAVQKARATQSDFEQSLKSTKGLITETTNELLLSKLHDAIKPENLDALGISYVDLAHAILQGKDATKSFLDELNKTHDYAEAGSDQLEGLTQVARVLGQNYSAVGGEVDSVAQSFWAAQDAVIANELEMAALNGETGGYIVTASDAASAMLGLSSATDTTTSSLFGLLNVMDESTVSTNNYLNKVESLIASQKNAGAGMDLTTVAGRENQNTLLDLIQTNGALYDSYVKQGMKSQDIQAEMDRNKAAYLRVAQALGVDSVTALKMYEDRIDSKTSADLANMAALEALSGALQTAAGNEFAMAAATAIVSGNVDQQRNSLYNLGGQAGFTKSQVDEYVAALQRAPAQVVTSMAVYGTTAASNAIDAAARPRTTTITVRTEAYTVHYDLPRALGKATGGSIWGPGTGLSDSIPAWLSNGEFVIRASVANKYRQLLEYLNRMGRLPKMMPKFASGGSVPNLSQIVNQNVRRMPSITVPPATVSPASTTNGFTGDARAVGLLEELVAQGRSGAGLSTATMSRALVGLLAPGMDAELGVMQSDRVLGV